MVTKSHNEVLDKYKISDDLSQNNYEITTVRCLHSSLTKCKIFNTQIRLSITAFIYVPSNI